MNTKEWLAAIGTLSLAHQDVWLGWVFDSLEGVWPAVRESFMPFLLLNLLLYGCVTTSRQTLTQALILCQ